MSPDGVYPRFPSELISTSCSRWTNRTAFAHSQLPLIEMTTQVIERAKMSVNPKEIPPGTYPVVFHAAAVSSLIPWVIWNLDARAADEGRSFMSRMNEKGQPIGNRVGESMFSPLVEVERSAAHPLLQSGTLLELRGMLPFRPSPTTPKVPPLASRSIAPVPPCCQLPPV